MISISASARGRTDASVLQVSPPHRAPHPAVIRRSHQGTLRMEDVGP